MANMGGLSKTHNADENTQHICDKVKQDVEKKAGKNYHVFVAKLYRTQIVAGTNFFIKVSVGGDDYDHIKVLQKLPCYGGGLELIGIQQHKTYQDPIEPF